MMLMYQGKEIKIFILLPRSGHSSVCFLFLPFLSSCFFFFFSSKAQFSQTSQTMCEKPATSIRSLLSSGLGARQSHSSADLHADSRRLTRVKSLQISPVKPLPGFSCSGHLSFICPFHRPSMASSQLLRLHFSSSDVDLYSNKSVKGHVARAEM